MIRWTKERGKMECCKRLILLFMMMLFKGFFSSLAGPVPGYDMQRAGAGRTQDGQHHHQPVNDARFRGRSRYLFPRLLEGGTGLGRGREAEVREVLRQRFEGNDEDHPWGADRQAAQGTLPARVLALGQEQRRQAT